MLKVVLPLIATGITDSPALVAAVALTLSLPWLLTALHVGVLVDRFDRRRLLLLANLTRVVTMTAFVAVMLFGSVPLPLLYGVGLVLGVAEVVAMTSAAAIVPSAVAPRARERANAWVAGAETACGEFTGPFLGGVLAAIGVGLALGATGAAYAVGMLVLLFLVGRFAPRTGDERPVTSVHARIVEGVAYLWRNRLLRGLALMLTVLSGCWGAWLALMPLFATAVMDLSPQEYGVLMSALGAGGIVGALSVRWVNRFLGRRWAMFADLLGTVAMMAAPALTTNMVIVSTAAFLGGMGGTLWTVNVRTISQRVVPREMLGRYNAAARLFSWGAMPIGAALVGVLAEFVGIPLAFAFFALAATTTVVPFLRIVTPTALDASAEVAAAR
ncbi:MFS transporter [Spiractinospora alimapuensis]|uniref:MFS transporter n=1 Tax=Spiractinospora alimapuensis TaxID=2820884 RepID=UPI0037432E2A